MKMREGGTGGSNGATEDASAGLVSKHQETKQTDASPSLAYSRDFLKQTSTQVSSLPKKWNDGILLPDGSYYETLGLSDSTAGEDEIRQAYYSLSKLYHPDKCRSSEYRAKLSLAQCAYNVLSDKTKRTIYDIRIGLYRGNDKFAKLAEVQRLQKEKAEKTTEALKEQYDEHVATEQERKGLLLLKAWYGNLRLKQPYIDAGHSGPISLDYVEGPWSDVTVPLQCQVVDSKIIIPGGAFTSKSDIDGFYDPVATLDSSIDLCLYVLYSFQGELHEVTVTDKEKLAIPLKVHRLSGLPFGPFAPSNLSSGRHLHRVQNFGQDQSFSFNEPGPRLTTVESVAQPLNSEEDRILNERHRRKCWRQTRLSTYCWLATGAVAGWCGVFFYANYFNKEAVVRGLHACLERSVPMFCSSIRTHFYSSIYSSVSVWTSQVTVYSSDFWDKHLRQNVLLCCSFGQRLLLPIWSFFDQHTCNRTFSPVCAHLRSGIEGLQDIWHTSCNHAQSTCLTISSQVQTFASSLPTAVGPAWYQATSFFCDAVSEVLPPTPSDNTRMKCNECLGVDAGKRAWSSLMRGAQNVRRTMVYPHGS